MLAPIFMGSGIWQGARKVLQDQGELPAAQAGSKPQPDTHPVTISR